MKNRLWRRFNEHALAVPALFVLLSFLLFAALGTHFAPFDANYVDAHARLLPPLWSNGGDARYILGTDDFGRDMLSRIIHGAHLTIGLAAVVVTLAFVAGVFLGLLSAQVGGLFDIFLMRMMDVLLAVPSLLLAIILVAALDTGLANTIYAVALSLLPHFFRSTRRALREELTREYVAAARLDGGSGLSLMLQTLLPNIAAVLIVQTTMALSTAVLDITALGFLGLGAQPPAPEWGALLASAHDFIQIAPWTVLVPGGAIFLAVLSINLVGDALRTTLDPKSQHS